MVTPVVADRITSLGNGPHKYLVGLPEYELWKELGSLGKRPGPTEELVRCNFWSEYFRVKRKGEKRINFDSVTGTIMSRETFYKYFIINPFRLSWMLCPPKEYTELLAEIATFGLRQLREILEVPLDPSKPAFKTRADQRLAVNRLIGELTGRVHITRKDVKRHAEQAMRVEEKVQAMTELDLEEKRKSIQEKRKNIAKEMKP